MKVTVRKSGLNGRLYRAPLKERRAQGGDIGGACEGAKRNRQRRFVERHLGDGGGVRGIGASVRIEPSGRYCTLYIKGGLKSGNAVIDCAESGSTLRFMIPVACTLPGRKTFIGRGRLPRRPVDEYISIFERQGIGYEKPEAASLPLTVTGRLSGGEFTINGGVSSQYITGLMLALPLLETDSAITVEGTLESKGYVGMTIDMLSESGIEIGQNGGTYIIKGNQKYKPQRLAVEGDYSQAAFFIAGAALCGDVTVEGLRADSLQPDRAIVDIMQRMGADIEMKGDMLRVKKSRLRGVTVDISQCPDLAPPIAAAAALAEGETRITGAARLRIKESDRLHALAENLSRIGIKAKELPDELIIRGGRANEENIDSFGDHRIAMAFSVIALCGTGDIKIDGAECVNKSYPLFFEDLKALGGNVK